MLLYIVRKSIYLIPWIDVVISNKLNILTYRSSQALLNCILLDDLICFQLILPAFPFLCTCCILITWLRNKIESLLNIEVNYIKIGLCSTYMDIKGIIIRKEV